MTELEALAIRVYEAIGIHPAVFDIPHIRSHALRLIRRLMASGCDAEDCITREMNAIAREEIARMAEALKRIRSERRAS
jgi:hypothetical protein